MARSVTQQIASASGQPSSVRIGRVDNTNPTVITAQGVVFNDVGFLNSYANPQFGDVVALLGQSSQAGTDPTSWLCLGKIDEQPSPMQIQAGEELFTFAAATSSFIDVVFATPFAAIPAITCTIANNAGVSNGWTTRAGLPTVNGFRLTVSTLGAAVAWTNIPVHWHAITMTQ